MLTLAACSVVVFLVLEVLPGDVAEVMLGTEAREDTLAALRRQLGLDRPPLEQLPRLDRRRAGRRSGHRATPTACPSPSCWASAWR